MATVTNSRRRGERSSGSNKVAASKPKLRQTSVANRGAQSGTPKPGTYTSNNTMAKKPSPTNKRGGAQRKTGGKAGGRAGRPSGPVAGTKDKTVRVPASWKAQTVDPTNQRGGNQRPTGGLAGGRAGRPSGNIARPPAKPASTPKPAGNFKAPSLPKGTVKVAGKALSTLGKVGRGLGVAGAVLGAVPTINSIVNPRSEGNQQLAKAMAAVNKRFSSNYGPRFKNPNTGPVASKGAKPKAPMPKGSSEALREKSYASLQKFNVPKPKAGTKPKPVTPKTTTARSSTTARTSASRPAAKPAAKTTLRPDTVQGVGPIKSGDTYSRNIKKQSEPGKNFAGSKDMPNAAATYNTKTSYGSRVNSSFSAESPAAKPSASSKKSSTMTQAEILKRRRGF
jgi:hypothetical protein